MPRSLHTLLNSVVDYAGLFPPAQLALDKGVSKYAQYQKSLDKWLLGRFVIPLTRLPELAKRLYLTLENPVEPLSLSVILSQNWESDLGILQTFNRTHRIFITALEFPPMSPSDIKRVISHLPKGVEPYFEIPLKKDLSPYWEVLGNTRASAKVRTGGLISDAFPSLTQLSQFMFNCAEAQVSFKATAGLHHPLTGQYPITREPGSSTTRMYGFLNLAIAAALVYWQIVIPEEVRDILSVSTIDNFQFQDDELWWRDRPLKLSEIAEARHKFFRSFGSCSFQEPVDELKELQIQ